MEIDGQQSERFLLQARLSVNTRIGAEKAARVSMKGGDAMRAVQDKT